MSNMTENILEETCLYWLEELVWHTIHGLDIAQDTPDAERDSYSDVILKERLRTALSQINPDVPAVGIYDAVKKLLVADSPDLLVNNRIFHRLLTDGVDVEYHQRKNMVEQGL